MSLRKGGSCPWSPAITMIGRFFVVVEYGVNYFQHLAVEPDELTIERLGNSEIMVVGPASKVERDVSILVERGWPVRFEDMREYELRSVDAGDLFHEVEPLQSVERVDRVVRIVMLNAEFMRQERGLPLSFAGESS